MFAPDYPIETERLLLRPFTAADLDAYHSIQSRSDVARYLYWAPRTRQQVRDVLQQRAGAHALASEGDTLDLAVMPKGESRLIGSVMLRWLSAEHRQGEIGFILHPDQHGQGFAREAAAAMLQVGFASFGLHRIIGRCDGRNAASQHLMKRLGMRREAHFRQNEFVKGEWCDEVVFAIMAEEWGGST